MRKMLRLGVGMATVAAVVATGAFAGSGRFTSSSSPFFLRRRPHRYGAEEKAQILELGGSDA